MAVVVSKQKVKHPSSRAAIQRKSAPIGSREIVTNATRYGLHSPHTSTLLVADQRSLALLVGVTVSFTSLAWISLSAISHRFNQRNLVIRGVASAD